MTLGVLTIMILLTLTIGTSYSYYSISDVQDQPNNLTTTCFNVEFTDGTNGSIKLNGDGKYGYPMSDTNALKSNNYYEFTLKNACTSEGSFPVKYDIFLGDKGSNTLSAEKIKYKLVEVTGDSVTPTGTGTKLNTTSYPITDIVGKEDNMTGIVNGYKLGDNATGLATNASKKYRLYMWIDENATNDIMGQTFTGSLIVYAYM